MLEGNWNTDERAPSVEALSLAFAIQELEAKLELGREMLNKWRIELHELEVQITEGI